VNGHFAVPTGPASLVAARMAGVPHVMSVHGGDLYDPSKKISPHKLPIVPWVIAYLLRHSDAVVSQSDNTSANAIRYYHYDGPIEMIPLGIRQPDVVPPTTRAALGLPENVFLTVTVGRLVKRKALDQLLLALTRPACAAVHFVVIGAGPEGEHWQAQARELGLESRVRFLGRVEETRKWQILQNCDAYVSSTLHEGFGLVYLEAMTAGLPVITPDHGGQVDFLKDGENGLLVRAGDTEALAAAIARLAADPEAARRMGRANLAVSPRHNVKHCAAGYEALFERLIAARASRTRS
jgi:glycosyltransferase involved in cell wall biosynthesis